MINLDSCKDVLLYLYPPSAQIPISVSNSSDIRLRVNKDGNDTREFNDYFIPESFVFKINDDMKLESKVHFRYRKWNNFMKKLNLKNYSFSC